MSVATWTRNVESLLDGPTPDVKPSHLRPICPFGHDSHRTVRAPYDGDDEGQIGNHITDSGWVCLDCRVAFGGGMGLVTFR